MKKFIITVLTIFMISPLCFAFNLNGSGLRYAGRMKYCPQYNMYSNRYRQQQKNYIYSPQQARYYGYRVPQQRGYYNQYNNPYRRY